MHYWPARPAPPGHLYVVLAAINRTRGCCCFSISLEVQGSRALKLIPPKSLGSLAGTCCPARHCKAEHFTLATGCSQRAPPPPSPADLPPCSCAPGGRFAFRTCTLKRLADPAAPPPLWDDSKDWTSGVVL